MSIERFARQIKWVMCSALLAAGFAGCSGSGANEPSDLANEPSDPALANEPNNSSESVELTSAPSDPNAEESVGLEPPQFCNGCYIDDFACEGQLAPGCFCTVDFDCCIGFPPIAMVCVP